MSTLLGTPMRRALPGASLLRVRSRRLPRFANNPSCDPEMTMKKKLIVLDKLADESAKELESMVSELRSDSQQDASRWSKRFAASGKGTCSAAPKIRAD